MELILSPRFWRSVDYRRTPETSVFCGNGVFGFQLSADHVILKTPYFAAFYFAQKDYVTTSALERMIKSPQAVFDSIPCTTGRNRGFAFSQRRDRSDPGFGGRTGAQLRWIAADMLSGFCDAICQRICRRAKTVGFFLGSDLFLSRPQTLEPLPDEKVGEPAFLSQLLMLRVRALCSGLDSPRMRAHLPGISQIPVVLPRRSPRKELKATPSALAQLDQQIGVLTFDWFCKSIGWSMESMIRQTVLRRLQEVFESCCWLHLRATNGVAIYGAGDTPSYCSVSGNDWADLP
ncbi:MAG: hypothetical protein IPL39_12325 [Opitutaceae bacterium]|nr:hypothetical protein [Opitutaceae bacterium]